MNSSRKENSEGGQKVQPRKRNILFIIDADERWMGGAYYARNMIYTLLSYPPSRQTLHVFIFVKEKHLGLVSAYHGQDNVTIIIWGQLGLAAKALKKAFNSSIGKLSGIPVFPEIQKILKRYPIDYVYPLRPKNFNVRKLHDIGIAWIPDFQHIHYPEYFSGRELAVRNRDFSRMAHQHNKLVLSSQSAYADYKRLYPDSLKEVYVVPFASMARLEIADGGHIGETIKKYVLPGKYFMVCNQFWKHKNHQLILEAIGKCVASGIKDVYVACTGKMDSYKDPEYIEGLQSYIQSRRLEEHIRFLGVIDRQDQLRLMMGCTAVIQPSLFEGWGTVVEDAKALGKDIVMSDIDVHYEQRDERCTIFPRNDAEQLADIMARLWGQAVPGEYKYSFQTGHAAEYGKRLYEILSK